MISTQEKVGLLKKKLANAYSQLKSIINNDDPNYDIEDQKRDKSDCEEYISDIQEVLKWQGTDSFRGKLEVFNDKYALNLT